MSALVCPFQSRDQAKQSSLLDHSRPLKCPEGFTTTLIYHHDHWYAIIDMIPIVFWPTYMPSKPPCDILTRELHSMHETAGRRGSSAVPRVGDWRRVCGHWRIPNALPKFYVESPFRPRRSLRGVTYQLLQMNIGVINLKNVPILLPNVLP